MSPALSISARLRQFSDRLDSAVVAICAAMLAVMLLISALGVIAEVALALRARLGLAASADEFLQFVYANTRPSAVRPFLPWLGMLSVTVAFKRREHVAIALLVENLPRPWRRAAASVHLAAIALFAVALVWQGLGFALGAGQPLILSSSLQVPFAWSAASVPAAGLVLCAHLARGLTLAGEEAEQAAGEAARATAEAAP
ncbi:MAG: TRAP transporter small permease [Microvirga sp.]|nr:TRAP transporter small permease [Microvirga sp.]